MTPLQNLSIIDSKILQQRCQKEVGKEWYKISHVPNIEFNYQHVQKDGVWIQKDETGHEETSLRDLIRRAYASMRISLQHLLVISLPAQIFLRTLTLYSHSPFQKLTLTVSLKKFSYSKFFLEYIAFALTDIIFLS